jgi:hypothetical protein
MRADFEPDEANLRSFILDAAIMDISDAAVSAARASKTAIKIIDTVIIYQPSMDFVYARRSDKKAELRSA